MTQCKIGGRHLATRLANSRRSRLRHRRWTLRRGNRGRWIQRLGHCGAGPGFNFSFSEVLRINHMATFSSFLYKVCVHDRDVGMSLHYMLFDMKNLHAASDLLKGWQAFRQKRRSCIGLVFPCTRVRHDSPSRTRQDWHF